VEVSPSVTALAGCAEFTWLLAVAARPAATFVVDPTPEPDSATVVGEPFALLVTVSVPERVPAAVGVNVTPSEQDEPAAIVVHVPDLAKSPEVVTPETVAVDVPVLVIVTFCAVVVAPTTVDANARLCGSADSTGPGATPVPVSATGVAEPPTVTVSVPLAAPAAVGENVTPTEHEAPAASDEPHVDVCANGPETATATVCAAVPLLATVTVRAALVVPVACDPNDSELGVTVTSFSGTYGGQTGVANAPHAGVPEIPELPPPSVTTKFPPSQL
jgi:hypothetical protein